MLFFSVLKACCYVTWRNYATFIVWSLKFMLTIILLPVLSSSFYRLGLFFFIHPLIDELFLCFCLFFFPHVHLYWPAHRQYAFWYMTSIPCKLVKLQARLCIVSLTDSSFFITSSSAGFCFLSLLRGNIIIFQKLLDCLNGINWPLLDKIRFESI